MNTQEINRLLEKYYNGTASDEEETMLRNYFEGESVHADFTLDNELFTAYSRLAQIPEPSADLPDRIMAAIDDPLKVSSSVSLIRRSLYAIISTAAVFLVLLGSYVLITEKNKTTNSSSDSQIAYAETMNILREVSSKINTGLDALEPLRRSADAAEHSLRLISNASGMTYGNLEVIDYLKATLNNLFTQLDAATSIAASD